MATESMVGEEPELTVRPRPRFFLFRRDFVRLVALPAAVALFGGAALVFSGNVALPFARIVTVTGKLGSKAEIFEDGRIRELLLRHHLRVQVTASSSYELIEHPVDRYDFVFPSDWQTAELIENDRERRGLDAHRHQPFVSPIVLASYREYAETLRAAGVAVPQAGAGPDGPLYYHLDLGRFLDLIRDGRRWDDLGVERHGAANGNRVAVHTPGVCLSASGAIYLGLVAFAENGNDVVRTPAEAESLARRITPLIGGDGQPSAEILRKYISPEGPGIFPIVVMYEHQFLAYQIDRRNRLGNVDGRRVLLYPAAQFMTEPELIALTPEGRRLAALFTTDPDIRQRLAELGLRILSPGTQTDERLPELLRQWGVPVPRPGRDGTRSVLPPPDLMKRMTEVAAGC